MDSAPRQGLGTFFRALIDFVEEKGLLAQVREKVSPQTRALIEKPPRPMSFLPSRPIDEVETALLELTSAEVCVECGLAVARPLGWSLLQPVLRIAFQFLGQSAEPIFGNLDRFFSLVTRGIEFSWERGEKGGTVMARFDGPDTPEAAFHVLRGSLLFAFEASGTTGAVSAPEIVESTPAEAVVRYRVSWA
ncbi:MAG: hypothetical protein ABR567_03600 [Myxococcales bacterium]|nr:hypothetical protein [Myxococcales bacterium]